MRACRALAIAVASSTVLVPRAARAAQSDAREVGDEAHVLLDASGTATFEHRFAWRAGRVSLRFIDVAGVDPGAAIEPAASVTGEDGATFPARAVRGDDQGVRVSVEDPRDLVHGTFTFAVRWRVDLVATGALRRDGANWRLSVGAPPAADGFDGARMLLDVPVAVQEPRPVVPETGMVEEGALATLRRGPEKDTLDLFVPHVARGQSVVWTIRLDPHALPLAVDPPRVTQAAPAAPGVAPARAGRALDGLGLAGVGLCFALLVAQKARAFSAQCRKRRAQARSLLPIPEGARALAAGALLAAGVALQGTGEMTEGGACVALAALVAALRAPRAVAVVRGPGRWVARAPERLFTVPAVEEHWLDAATPAGRRSALAAGVLVLLAAVLVRRWDVEASWLVGLDASVLVALLGTGSVAQLPPDGARSAAPWLAWAFARLRGVDTLRVAAMARVALDGASADELRLLVVPRAAMPGVVGLEVGVGWAKTPVRWAASPEVLARVLEGSAAARRLAREVPRSRAIAGRRADERVWRLLPRAPTRSDTLALVRALANALTDRRASVHHGTWSAPERRAASAPPPDPRPPLAA